MANQHSEKLRGIRQIREDLWTDYDTAARAVGSDRSAISRQLFEWFVGRPGAELPERPPPVEREA